MDVMAVLALIERGVSIIQAVSSAGGAIETAANAVKNLASKAQTGEVSDADLDEVEKILDEQIEEFNLDL